MLLATVVDMSDEEIPNRRQDRRRNVRIASIVVSVARAAIPCVILDISSSGARLHVHDPAEIPDVFRLIQTTTQEEHECSAVWRAGNEMGVKFTP